MKKTSMTNKYSVIIIILFVSLLTMNFRCMKDVEPRPFEQAFLIPVDIYPLKKSYSLTDTIWIETDLTNKFLFDTKSNQNILVDSGQITFGAGFNEFGTYITNPPNGFCDIITINGVNTNRQLSHWGTCGSIENFGCGQASFKCRVGFKPKEKGTYWLSLAKDLLLESCNNKIVPYYATVSYKYKNVDLNLDIFNSLSKNDKGGNDGIKFYTDKIINREGFVFRVE